MRTQAGLTRHKLKESSARWHLKLKFPTLGESIVEGTISKWLKQVGDTVAVGDSLVELETDKINLEVPAEQAGVLTSIRKGEGENVAVGEVLGMIDKDTSAKPAEATAPKTDNPQAKASQPEESATASKTHEVTPVAQRAAADLKVDLQSVAGSGPGGRITKDDVLKSVKSPESTESSQQSTVSQSPNPSATLRTNLPISNLQSSRPEERIRMSRRRQTIARRLVEAQQTAAMLTTFNEVDMSKIMEIRKRRKESFQERHGVGLGFMSFFSKAVIGALKQFPPAQR